MTEAAITINCLTNWFLVKQRRGKKEHMGTHSLRCEILSALLLRPTVHEHTFVHICHKDKTQRRTLK